MLPQELAVLFVKADEASQIDGTGIAFDVAVAVVRADIDFAVGNHRIAVSFGSQWHRPADVFASFNIPFDRNVFGIRGIIARSAAAPLRPVILANFHSGNLFGQEWSRVFASDRISAASCRGNQTQPDEECDPSVST